MKSRRLIAICPSVKRYRNTGTGFYITSNSAARLPNWVIRVNLFRFHIDLPLDDDREREHKRRALPGLRLDPDLAAMHLDDALRYGEA
jgi:hypothetical protein